MADRIMQILTESDALACIRWIQSTPVEHDAQVKACKVELRGKPLEDWPRAQDELEALTGYRSIDDIK